MRCVSVVNYCTVLYCNVLYCAHAHHRAVVHPGAQLEPAQLVVEGEEHDVDAADGAELGGRGPEHVPRVVHDRQAAEVALGVVISAEIGAIFA